MEKLHVTKSNHKKRRIVKDRLRIRLRRLITKEERDVYEKRLTIALESSKENLKLRAKEEKRETETRELEQHAEQKKFRPEEEIIAQEKLQFSQEQIPKEEQQEGEMEEIKIGKEFKTELDPVTKILEDTKEIYKKQLCKEKQLHMEIDSYIDGVKTPEILREVEDSRPTNELCLDYTRAGVCPYGDMCYKNHRKVFLSNVILVPRFYPQSSPLEKAFAKYEYETNSALNLEPGQCFYNDVITKLKSFDRIKSFNGCYNKKKYLRGNLYIEFYTERDAAKAWRDLKGRWYDGKRLKCEFVNPASWKLAICRRTNCLLGSEFCTFLHTFEFPHNKYVVKSPLQEKRYSCKRIKHRRMSVDGRADQNDDEDPNWRKTIFFR